MSHDDVDNDVECGTGWKSLYAPLMERSRAEGAAVLQVKEKMGGLRFYVMGGSEALHEAIADAERRSLTLCEQCGDSGVLRKGGGQMKTLCDQHAKGRDASGS